MSMLIGIGQNIYMGGKRAASIYAPPADAYSYVGAGPALAGDLNGLTFSADGTRIILCTYNVGTDYVRQYDLDTAWLASSINTSTLVTNATIARNNMRGIRYSPDGDRLMYVRSDSTTAQRIYHWLLPTNYSIAGSTVGASRDIAPWLTGLDARGLFIHPNGDRVWTDNVGVLREFGVTTPWAMNTINNTVPKSAAMNHVNDVFFSPSGLTCYTVSTVAVWFWNLTTAWDIDTMPASPSSTLDLTGQTNNARAIYVKDDGSSIYVHDDITDKTYQYDAA